MPEVVENSSPVKRTPPNCARCKNHGVKNILSGHKRYCLYLECKCSKCLSTVERQRAMAKNTAYRRAERQHKKKLEEWQKRAQTAREMGQQIPPEPAELPSPILSPKVRTPSEYSSSERNLSPKSNYSPISSDVLSVSSLNSRDKGKCSYRS